MKNIITFRTFIYRFKLLIILCLLFVLTSNVSAQTSVGPKNAATGTDVSTGNTAWSNPGNITSIGSPYATVALSPSNNSHYLQATGYGFSIPTAATINGIIVTINRTGGQSLSIGFRDDLLYLVKNAVIQTSGNKASGTTWPTSFSTASYGTSSDLWGQTWTPEDINNANFGVALSVHSNLVLSTLTATVDYMQITVTYTCNVPAQPSVITGSTTPCQTSTQTYTVTNISGVTYTWGYSGTGTTINSGQGTSTLSVGYSSIATTGTWTVTPSNGCGNGPGRTLSATVNTTPSAPIADSNGPVCLGSTLSLTASTISGANYNWTGPNSFTSSTQNTTVSTYVTTAMSGTYSVTATMASCTSTAGTTMVTVNPLPAASATKTDISCFNGNNGQIVISGANGSGNYNYSINNGSLYQTSNTFSSLAPGQYKIRVKDMNTQCESPAIP